MLRASKDKMTTYIGTKFGDDAAQEWTREKQITLNEPVYPQSILNRHAKRDQITLKVTSLKLEKTIIDDEIKLSHIVCKLMTEKQETKDQIL